MREDAGARAQLKMTEPLKSPGIPAEKAKIAALENEPATAKKQDAYSFKTAPGIPPQVPAPSDQRAKQTKTRSKPGHALCANFRNPRLLRLRRRREP